MMLDTTKQLISMDELDIYTEEIKAYVKNKEVGLTENDVINIFNNTDTSVQISEDDTYEPLDTEG